jgi:hypothetical protein
MTMRTTSFLSIGALALALAAPLATVAYAGDHAGDQWRSNADLHEVTTSYVQADPALQQLEAKVYHQDQARQGAEMANSGRPAVTITK